LLPVIYCLLSPHQGTSTSCNNIIFKTISNTYNGTVAYRLKMKYSKKLRNKVECEIITVLSPVKNTIERTFVPCLKVESQFSLEKKNQIKWD
jgi:hypothetical protein